jgi:uncharacterized spore protein YtfJ
MTEQELLERAKDVRAERVFGQPVERDGVVLVPAARLGAGVGGGKGEGPQAEGSGSGFGYGFGARPAGAYVIREGKVSWQPAVDVNRLMLGFQVVAVVALLTVRAIVKARARGTPRVRGRRG